MQDRIDLKRQPYKKIKKGFEDFSSSDVYYNIINLEGGRNVYTYANKNMILLMSIMIDVKLNFIHVYLFDGGFPIRFMDKKATELINKIDDFKKEHNDWIDAEIVLKLVYNEIVK